MAADIEREPGRIEFANALRGVAALCVVLSHYYGVYWYSRPAVARFTGMALLPAAVPIPSSVAWFNTLIAPLVTGPFGVALFFLISGFVIPFSFDNKTARQFLIGRFFRIWPTYFFGFLLSIGIVTIALYGLHRPVPFWPKYVLLHAVLGVREMTTGQIMDGVIWTLETEVWFYLFAAGLGRALLSRGSPLTYLAPALVLFYAVALKLLNLHFQTPRVLGLPRALAFYCPYVIFIFIGVSLNFRYRGMQSRARTAFCLASLLAAAALALVLTPDTAPGFLPYIAPSYGAALLLFLGAMALWRARFWSALPLRFLAAISYPLYVVHALIGFTILNLLMATQAVSPNLAVAIAFAAAIGIAWLLHIAVEMPSQKTGAGMAARA